MQAYWILAPILIPVVTGVILLLRPVADDRKRNIVIEAVVIVNTILTLYLIANRPDGTFYLFTLGTNLSIALGIDGLSMLFGGMVALLWPFASLYAFEYMRHEERKNSFMAFYTITYGVTLGIAFSANIVTMYLFYEMLTLVTLPLVMHYMDREARYATRKYLYYMIGGTAFAFIAIVFYTLMCSDLAFALGGNLNPAQISRNGNLVLLAYLFGFFGFGVKAAVFPFHGWLPSASVAPTPVTALLHAVAVVKAGVFAIIRLTWYCFGPEVLTGTWAQVIVTVFVMFTVAYGSTMGVRETHFKRRLAYSTVANLSYILLGVVTMTPAGLAAGLAHMLVHAVTKISGFFCAGAVMHQTGKNYVYELDGLGRKMPVTFTAFLIAGLSLTGVPLFAGFISKWQLIQSLLGTGSVLGIAGVLVLLYSALMTGIYMLTVVVRAFFPEAVHITAAAASPTSAKDAAGTAKNLPESSAAGAPSKDETPESEKYTDPNWLMTVPLIVFSVVIILIGCHAQPLLNFVGNIAAGAL